MISEIRLPLALICAAAIAGPANASVEPEVFEIEVRYETSSQSDDGGSSSSSGGFSYREEAYAPEGKCRIRRFDLNDGPRERPLAAWEMPVEVRDCRGQSLEITNREEMLARLDEFLTEANLSREACGTHYFTWNVFKIECDPDSVLDTISDINLGAIDLEDGSSLLLPGMGTDVTLALEGNADSDELEFTGSARIDPEILRNQAAQTIMVVAELNREPISREEAFKELEAVSFSGEVSVTLEFNSEDDGITLVKQSQVIVTDPESGTEIRRGREVTVRERAEPAAGFDPSQVSSN